jgi:hypothetical protein
VIDLVKPIRLSKHALSYEKKRGFSVAEVEETIRTSSWEVAELGRLPLPKRLCVWQGLERQVLHNERGSSGVRRGSWRNSCDHRLYLLFLIQV